MTLPVVVLLLLAACAACAVQGRSLEAKQNQYVHFLLWTRRNPTVYDELRVDDEASLINSHYDASLPTFVFAHGFTQNGQDGMCTAIRDEFLMNQDCNYISVDWGRLVQAPNYPGGVLNVAKAGLDLGNLILFLVRQGASVNQFHLIGFSLGAHVAGFAGKVVGNLPHITGLDPAYPLFSLTDTESRLDTSDAAFVDVIHTNSGDLLDGALSFPQPIGHVDFFPNGGNAQPGCTDKIVNMEKADILDLIQGCSHGRAPDYFIESINGSPKFVSGKCDSYANWASGACSSGIRTNMGFGVSTSVRGQFYLVTNAATPFAKG